MLNDAIKLATMAHAGQVDKAGEPYILHPLRVMLACNSEQERIVAVLHDVVEDSDYTLTDIACEFGSEIADALECLTKRKGERYADFIQRVRGNDLAVGVKIADLNDNMNMDRLPKPLTEADHLRYEKYRDAYRVLRDGDNPF